MRIIPFLLLFLLLPTPKYAPIFGNDYQKAMETYHQNQANIKNIALQFDLGEKWLASIVFPEWIRYSYFQDFFETATLELLYIENGTKYADFSIGKCQMKPSFVEKLEESVLAKPSLLGKYSFILVRGEAKSQRKIRLERLKDFQWQMRYLVCFVGVMKDKFAVKTFHSETEKLKFYASAYNAGFHKSEEKIEKQMKIPTFPYGAETSLGKQYIYADVAADFFENAE